MDVVERRDRIVCGGLGGVEKLRSSPDTLAIDLAVWRRVQEHGPTAGKARCFALGEHGVEFGTQNQTAHAYQILESKIYRQRHLIGEGVRSRNGDDEKVSIKWD